MRDRDSGGLQGQGDGGQATVEYALLIGTGAAAVIAAMLFLAGAVDRVFGKAGDATGEFRPPVVLCDANYGGVCVPPGPPDLDCEDLPGLGIPTPVQVIGSDPHNLDVDGNGLGCDE